MLTMIALVLAGAVFFGAWHTLPKGMGNSFKVLPDARPLAEGLSSGGGPICGQGGLGQEDPAGSLASPR